MNRRSVLGFLAYGLGLFALAVWLVPAASAQNLATDPFVQQTLNGANFEPGGQFYPNLQVRGAVIPSTRSGQVSVSETSSQMLGRNLVLKSGSVQGTYNYTVRLSSSHPWTVHSPFDNTSTASRTVREDSETKSIEVNLTVNGLLNHPADGYDPPAGGGFPTPNPLGAIDRYQMSISGQVQGTFLVNPQTIQGLDVAPNVQRTNFATYSFDPNVRTQDRLLLAGYAEGSTANGGENSLNQTLLNYDRNPTLQQGSDAERRGSNPLDTAHSVVAWSEKGANVVKYGSSVVQGVGLGGYLGNNFRVPVPNSPILWETQVNPDYAALSGKLQNAAKIGGAAKTAGDILKYVKFAIDAVDITTASNAEDFAHAVNQTVRDGVTMVGGKLGAWGGGAVGAYAGVHVFGVGALVGAPVGALAGYLYGSWQAGVAYDAGAAQVVSEWAAGLYNSQIKQGSIGGNAGAAVSNGFQNVFRNGSGGGGGGDAGGR